MPCTTLDATFADGGEIIDLLHMDIQGGEMKALMGTERLIDERRIRLIYCEIGSFRYTQSAGS